MASGRACRLRDLSRRDLRRLVVRLWYQLDEDRLGLVAAGVAFYSFLAIFPALAVLISIWGLIADPTGLEEQLGQVIEGLPEATQVVIGGALDRLAETPPGSLAWSTVVSLAVIFWSVNRGTSGLMDGVAIAYNEPDERTFVKRHVMTLVFTAGGVATFLIAVAMVVALPAVLDFVGLDSVTDAVLRLSRWPVLGGLVVGGLAMVYRVVPQRQPRCRFLAPGALIATGLWLLVSFGFSAYVSNFGSYNEIYGSVAAVAIMMVWLWVSAFVVLLGAEINSELQRLYE